MATTLEVGNVQRRVRRKWKAKKNKDDVHENKKAQMKMKRKSNVPVVDEDDDEENTVCDVRMEDDANEDDTTRS